MTEPVPPGIDLPALEAYFRAHIQGGDVPLTVRLLSGGRSNLTYLVEGGGRQWVLRRPPLGHVLPTAHDMAREYRVLNALVGTGVPAPVPFALCEDTSVLGQPFYLMDYRTGLICGEDWPQDRLTTEGERQALSRELIRTLAQLHAVDYRAVGLEGFGRPEGFLERQLRRWGQQWERSETRPLPELDDLRRRLERALPVSPPATIVHGDYRLGNLVLDDHDRISAIFDWEMATIGDPLTDLGWLLTHWGAVDDGPDRTGSPGFFSHAELVAEYARLTGRDVSRIDFYRAFAYFKGAVIVEGIHARFLKGQTVGEGFETFGRAPTIVRRAIELCDASEDSLLHA